MCRVALAGRIKIESQYNEDSGISGRDVRVSFQACLVWVGED